MKRGKYFGSVCCCRVLVFFFSQMIFNFPLLRSLLLSIFFWAIIVFFFCLAMHKVYINENKFHACMKCPSLECEKNIEKGLTYSHPKMITTYKRRKINNQCKLTTNMNFYLFPNSWKTETLLFSSWKKWLTKQKQLEHCKFCSTLDLP